MPGGVGGDWMHGVVATLLIAQAILFGHQGQSGYNDLVILGWW